MRETVQTVLHPQEPDPHKGLVALMKRGATTTLLRQELLKDVMRGRNHELVGMKSALMLTAIKAERQEPIGLIPPVPAHPVMERRALKAVDTRHVPLAVVVIPHALQVAMADLDQQALATRDNVPAPQERLVGSDLPQGLDLL